MERAVAVAGATRDERDAPCRTRLVVAILRDASVRLCPTYSTIVGSSYLRTPSVRYFVFAVEQAPARVKRKAVLNSPAYWPPRTKHLSINLPMVQQPPSSSSSSSMSSKGHRRELWGWLSYAFASEVFVIVSLTLFLPICLEQFARDNGFLLPDKTIPCSSNPTPPTGAAEEDEVRCVVKLGWAWIDTASFRCVSGREVIRASVDH